MTGQLEALLGAPLSLEVLKDKPGRRRTLRAQGPRGGAVVKVYASERSATVAERVSALSQGPAEPAVPRVLLCDEARHMVVLSYLPGTPLGTVLPRDRAACVRTGQALGAWHAFWRARVPACLGRHTSERELEIVAGRAGALAPSVAKSVRRIASSLRTSWRCATVVHRDLYEDQILLGDRIGLIDLDDAAAGPPELDMGNLLAHLELRALRAHEAAARATGPLLEGYAASGSALDLDLLDRCRRLSLLRLACIHGEPRLVELASSPRG